MILSLIGPTSVGAIRLQSECRHSDMHDCYLFWPNIMGRNYNGESKRSRLPHCHCIMLLHLVENWWAWLLTAKPIVCQAPLHKSMPTSTVKGPATIKRVKAEEEEKKKRRGAPVSYRNRTKINCHPPLINLIKARQCCVFSPYSANNEWFVKLCQVVPRVWLKGKAFKHMLEDQFVWGVSYR